MRILITCLIYLTICGTTVLSLHTNDAHFRLQRADDALWTEPLQTFKKFLKTDSEAARVELQNVAKTLFREHILTEEWVPLYFRLSREGTDHLSDFKRMSELEIRMLTAIDVKKYAKQIEHHRERLKHYDELSKIAEDEAPTPEMLSPGEQQVSSKTGHEHLKAFNELLPTDPEAARAKLGEFSVLTFHGHRLAKEWEELFFRLSREKAGTVSEIIRLLELKKQMLKDHSPEKHAEEIESLETAIKDLEPIRKLLKQQGTLDIQKFPFNSDMAPPE